VLKNKPDLPISQAMQPSFARLPLQIIIRNMQRFDVANKLSALSMSESRLLEP
jgi:hypothetical protein